MSFNFGFTPTNAPAATSANLTKLCELQPATFDALNKVLNLLQESGVVVIKNNTIIQTVNKGTTVLHTDISTLIKGTTINLTIVNPKKSVKLFKNMKSNNSVVFYDDTEFNRYLVNNGEFKVNLAKSHEEIENQAELPVFDNFTQYGVALAVDSDTASRIKTHVSASGKDYVDLLFDDNQLKAIYIPETSVYLFPQFTSTSIDEHNCQLTLRVFSFLLIDGDKYEFYIMKHKTNDLDYLFSTKISTGIVDIFVHEYVQPVSSDLLL